MFQHFWHQLPRHPWIWYETVTELLSEVLKSRRLDLHGSMIWPQVPAHTGVKVFASSSLSKD